MMKLEVALLEVPSVLASSRAIKASASLSSSPYTIEGGLGGYSHPKSTGFPLSQYPVQLALGLTITSISSRGGLSL
jgi:hypothetical protein